MTLLEDRPKVQRRVVDAVDRRFTFLDVLGDQIFFFVRALFCEVTLHEMKYSPGRVIGQVIRRPQPSRD